MASFTTVIRVVATVCGVLSISLTVLRLYYRWYRRHLGYDDAWAAFSLVSVFFMIAGAWLRSQENVTNEQRVIGYFMLDVSFTCVLWSARMSILFSIMRIIPYLMTLRRWAYGSAILFGLMWIVMLSEKIAVCEINDAWKTNPEAQCVLGKPVGGVELATDITADIILVALPIWLLWGINISASRRKLLMAIFSASIITTVVSIVHTSYELGPNRNAEGIAAHVEADMSLIICNLAVLMTWLVRTIFKGEDLESGGGLSDGSGGRKRTGNLTQLTSLRFGGGDQPIVLTTTAMDASSSDPDHEHRHGRERGYDGDDSKDQLNIKHDRLSITSPPPTDVTVTFGAEQMDAKMREDMRDNDQYKGFAF
ncbi:uncharacterized protein FIBRA_06165 [Fibroporia radiculosa]|uniref:Rhodopsin domain-containing protein n=1 Tax=Fibroporia radiculosa TaxID=599839 RepID=J4GAR7_9APHY|nr:uncharacterized protein FIBRA_06165 [Fibroporia radiculosa]CCM04008.1 predicted protein [Fibroporia radiculosa]